MSSAAAGVVHDQPRRAVGRRPVAPEELLGRLGGAALGRAHERGFAAAAQRPPHAQPSRDGVLHGELLGRHRNPTTASAGRRGPCPLYDERSRQRSTCARRPRSSAVAVDELGGRGVLGDVAHRLVDRDLVAATRGPARGRSSTSPSSVASAGSRPASSAQPAGGGANAWRGLDEQPRRRRERRVELAARRREADRGDVRARARLADAARTGVDDDVVRQITSAPSVVAAAATREAARAARRRVARRPSAHLGENVAHERAAAAGARGPDARADDGEHGGILARERARGRARRPRRSAAPVIVLAVHQRQADAGRGVEQADHAPGAARAPARRCPGRRRRA